MGPAPRHVTCSPPQRGQRGALSAPPPPPPRLAARAPWAQRGAGCWGSPGTCASNTQWGGPRRRPSVAPWWQAAARRGGPGDDGAMRAKAAAQWHPCSSICSQGPTPAVKCAMGRAGAGRWVRRFLPHGSHRPGPRRAAHPKDGLLGEGGLRPWCQEVGQRGGPGVPVPHLLVVHHPAGGGREG